MQKEELLNNLIDQLLTLPKFNDFSAEKKQVLKEKLIKEYNERINKSIVINMPIEKADDFLAVLETKKLDDIDEFILKNIPDIDNLIEMETSKFIQQIILKGNETNN